jgi:hypothetical protein
MKTALIAAVVSAIVAAASGTAATILVTSKNIKNGSIQTVDISAKAKRALKGNRGARGPAGARGATGAAGAAGPAGPQGIQRLVRVDATKAVAIDVKDNVVAVCPAGMVAVSGGFSTDADGTIFISNSLATGWFVAIDTAGAAFGGTFTASVFCSPNITTAVAATTQADLNNQVEARRSAH